MLRQTMYSSLGGPSVRNGCKMHFLMHISSKIEEKNLIV